MARALELMGLGLPSALARILSRTPGTITAVGTAIASATAITRDQRVAYVSTGTSAVALPAIGGDAGVLLGDDVVVVNATAADISVFAPGGVRIFGTAGSATGTVGVLVSAGNSMVFYAATASVWAGVKGQGA